MKLQTGCAAIALAGLAACNTGAAGTPSGIAKATRLLAECGASEPLIESAATAPDRRQAVDRLLEAKSTCLSAGVAVVHHPPPRVDSRLASAAVDEMAVSLVDIASAIEVADTSPQLARTAGRDAVRTYYQAYGRLMQARGRAATKG